MPIASGAHLLQARHQAQRVAHLAEGMAGQVRAHAAGQLQGIQPRPELVQGGGALDEFFFGAHIVRCQRAAHQPQLPAWPQLAGRRRGGQHGAQHRMPPRGIRIEWAAGRHAQKTFVMPSRHAATLHLHHAHLPRFIGMAGHGAGGLEVQHGQDGIAHLHGSASACSSSVRTAPKSANASRRTRGSRRSTPAAATKSSGSALPPARSRSR